MSKVKDENFYQISGWMINRLKLKGTMLNVYAIIYGFTQDGQSEFKGSRQYLCDFTGATKPTIDKALEDLANQKLIFKTSETINSITFNKYKANLEIVKNFTTDKETLPPDKETLQGGSKETLPNNNIYNNKTNNKDNKKEKKESEFDEVLNQIEDVNLKETLIAFIKMRKTIKKPMTTHALELLIKKLNRITTDVGVQIQMLEQSILNSWQDVYELKQEVKQINFIKNNYTKEQISGLITDLDNAEV